MAALIPVGPATARLRIGIGLRAAAATALNDNEERFLLGGAAHQRCPERTRLEAAPVSKKRIGLNRAPRLPMGFASFGPAIGTAVG